MYALLKRQADDAIVGVWTADRAEFAPDAPEGHEYVETTETHYREVQSTLLSESDRRPQWKLRDRDGEQLPVFEPVTRPEKRWFLVVRTNDSAVISARIAHKGELPDGVEGARVIECSEDEWKRVADQLRHEGLATSYAWRVTEDDELEPIPDARLVVTVTAATTVVELPASVVLTFSADGSQRGARRLALEVHRDGRKMKRLITLTDGAGSIDRQLEVGSYELRSGEPDVYVLTGDTRFEVVEGW